MAHGGFSSAGYDTNLSLSEEDSYITLLKLAGYRFDSSGVDAANKPVVWISYPAISLTSTEIKYELLRYCF